MSVKAIFFTQRATPELALKTARIVGKTAHFATDFMGRMEDGPDPACVRLEATQDEDTGLWQINRFTRIPGLGDGITRQETEASTGLCFFDALHYCARFQRTEEDLGKQAIPVVGKRWESIPNYKEAAKLAGQAIDADGEVHPCAYGRILTDGFFNDSAYADASLTQDQPLPETAKTARGNFVELLNSGLLKTDTPAAAETNLLDQSVNKRLLINDLKTVITVGDKFCQIFAKAINHRFTPAALSSAEDRYHVLFFKKQYVRTGIVSLLTAGLKPAWDYAKGDPRTAPVHATYKALSDLKNSGARLPTSPEKTLVEEFFVAAAYAVSMERAATVYHLCSEQEKSANNIKKGLPHIVEAARIINLSPVDTERLKADYLNGNVKGASFYHKMLGAWGSEEQWRGERGLRGNISDRINVLESNKPK